MGEPAKKNLLSVEDYLKGEKTAEMRHEYVDGEVYAMVGTTKVHNEIALNIALILRGDIAQRPCRVYMSDVKVHVQTKTQERFYYADLHVKCEPFTEHPYFSEHPKLVVEILSDSTERNDRSDKFYAYRRLPSLEEYILVAQDEPRVEIYRRATGWDLEIFGPGELFRLDSIGAEMAVDAVYEGVELEAT
jgi:Uma2 family endonuclease